MTSIIWGMFLLASAVVVALVILYVKAKRDSRKLEIEQWNKDYFTSYTEPVKSVTVKTHEISEPVTSFIKCFKDNPKRFKVTREGKASILKDTLTNKKWVFIFHNDRGYVVNVGGKSGGLTILGHMLYPKAVSG